MSVFVVLLLLEVVGLEEGVRGVLEGGDGVGSGRGRLLCPRAGRERRKMREDV